jgi:Carboxypeptidase regulatory-like domain
MPKTFRGCVITFFILAATTVLLFGQSDQGGIRGTVSDPTGGVVPGATVLATNVATGVTTSTITTSTGLYSIPTLRAGVYRLEVEKAGFKKVVRDNVTVSVGVIAGFDLTMEVGQTTQTIEVQAAAPLVEKETTTVDTSINPRSYLDLPINAGGSRSVEAFINLAPGVYGNGSFNYNANGGQLFSRTGAHGRFGR